MSAAETGDADAPGQPDYAIRVRDVGKRFDIYRNDRGRLLEFFGQKQHHREFWALRDISFDVQRGQAFGIIGPNGAGKSTLLRLLSGVSRPTEGEIQFADEVAGLLDLELGFHNDFTGIENIYLGCSLLGMSEEEIDAKVPQIIDFAEIEDFIDYPVRTYSAGMRLRLGFSIAAHVDYDVFLIDEVLAVGDQYFQRKCVKKIEEFLERGRTIILVTHDLHAVRSLCSSAMWLHAGRCVAQGPVKDVVDAYVDAGRERSSRLELKKKRQRQFGGAMSDEALRQARRSRLRLSREGGVRGPSGVDQATTAPLPDVAGYRCTSGSPLLKELVLRACEVEGAGQVYADEGDPWFEDYQGERPVIKGSGEIRILSVQTLDESGEEEDEFETFDALTIAVTIRTTEPVPRPILGIAFFRNDGVYVYGPNVRFDKVHQLDGVYDGVYTFFLHIPSLPLLGGTYRLSVAAFDQHHLKPHVWHNQLYELKVRTDREDHGLVYMEHHWGLVTHHRGAGEELS